MNSLIAILKIIIWPTTILCCAIIFRKGIVELIPKLKKLKYKDLEVEFEIEALSIQADVERDIPKIEKQKPKISQTNESVKNVQFCIYTPPPKESIIFNWQSIENEIAALRERHNLDNSSKITVRASLKELNNSGIIDNETNSILLNMSSFRNKVVHYSDKAINQKTASAFSNSTNRLLNLLKTR